jgi:hypothetical protein
MNVKGCVGCRVEKALEAARGWVWVICMYCLSLHQLPS